MQKLNSDDFSGSSDLLDREILFIKIVKLVSVLQLFYGAFYAIAGSWISTGWIAFGFLILSPLTLWIHKAGKHSTSKMLFLISCCSYILNSSLAFKIPIYNDFFYLNVLMATFIVFDWVKDRREIVLTIFTTAFFCIVDLETDNHPYPNAIGENIIPTEWHYFINLFGSSILTVAFMLLFVIDIRTMTKKLLDKNKIELEKDKLLRRQTDDLGTILNTSFNEIFMFDLASFKFVLVNESACKNLGYSTNDLIGKKTMGFYGRYERRKI